MDRQQLLDLAHLARLEFAPAEIDLFAVQLGKIIAYVNQLQAVPTDGVEPLAHAIPFDNVFRDDKPAPSPGAEAALANAPKRRDDFFAVPAIK